MAFLIRVIINFVSINFKIQRRIILEFAIRIKIQFRTDFN